MGHITVLPFILLVYRAVVRLKNDDGFFCHTVKHHTDSNNLWSFVGSMINIKENVERSFQVLCLRLKRKDATFPYKTG